MQTHTSHASLHQGESVSAAVNWSIGARAIATRTASNASPLVFVIDDDVALRGSLERLSAAARWEVETFVTATDVLSRPHAGIPCCLVLDLRRLGQSGLSLQTALAERTDLPIIFITGRGDIPTTVQAMKAGALDVLAMPVEDDVLAAAIHSALARSRAALAQQAKMQTLHTSYASLSRRERDVMALVVRGRLNKQAAHQLGISEITVKAHRGQVMRKMKADSLPHLVRMAAELGVLSSTTVSHQPPSDGPAGWVFAGTHVPCGHTHVPAAAPFPRTSN